VVEHKYCPNCGQQNTETRKTFYQLFVHFFEDLTHYEHSFWKTIRNLLLKPGALTKEYMSGKRMSYLAPVRLYIFISLVTFFYIALTPDRSDSLVEVSINDSKTEKVSDIGDEKFDLGFEKFSTVRELDSLQRIPAEKVSDFQYSMLRKVTSVAENNTRDQLYSKFRESFIRNLPKVLFIYMPLFAFLLWIFQNKRKWYYFDHGIFTLHYFSFLLLIYFILSVITDLLDMIDNNVTNFIQGLLMVLASVWTFYYFYPAHHRFYEESRLSSFIKGTVMFVINIFFIIVIMLLFVVYTFINIH